MPQRVIIESFPITGINARLEPFPHDVLDIALAEDWKIISSSPILVQSPEGEQFIFVTFVLEKPEPPRPRQVY